MIKVVKNGKVVSEGNTNQTSLANYAESLDNKFIPSEQWFYPKFRALKKSIDMPKSQSGKKLALERFEDKFNKPFAGYIPDVINHQYKYIVEIDGSIHNLENIKAKDAIKDLVYSFYGYKVFRVKGFNETSFNEFTINFKAYINTLPKRM